MKIPIVNNYNYDEVVGHIKGNEIHLREDLERRIVKSNNKLVKMEKEKDAEIAELKNEIDELNGQISEM